MLDFLSLPTSMITIVLAVMAVVLFVLLVWVIRLAAKTHKLLGYLRAQQEDMAQLSSDLSAVSKSLTDQLRTVASQAKSASIAASSKARTQGQQPQPAPRPKPTHVFASGGSASLTTRTNASETNGVMGFGARSGASSSAGMAAVMARRSFNNQPLRASDINGIGHGGILPSGPAAGTINPQSTMVGGASAGAFDGVQGQAPVLETMSSLIDNSANSGQYSVEEFFAADREASQSEKARRGKPVIPFGENRVERERAQSAAAQSAAAQVVEASLSMNLNEPSKSRILNAAGYGSALGGFSAQGANPNLYPTGYAPANPQARSRGDMKRESISRVEDVDNSVLHETEHDREVKREKSVVEAVWLAEEARRQAQMTAIKAAEERMREEQRAMKEFEQEEIKKRASYILQESMKQQKALEAMKDTAAPVDQRLPVIGVAGQATVNANPRKMQASASMPPVQESDSEE